MRWLWSVGLALVVLAAGGCRQQQSPQQSEQPTGVAAGGSAPVGQAVPAQSASARPSPLPLPALRSDVLDNLDASIRAMIVDPQFDEGSSPVQFQYSYSENQVLQTRGFLRMRVKQSVAPAVTIGARMSWSDKFGVPSGGWYPVVRTLGQVDFDFPPAMPAQMEMELEKAARGFSVKYETNSWGETRKVEMLSAIEPGFKQFVEPLVAAIKNPLVLFPGEPKRPGQTWTVDDTTTEDGIKTVLKGTYLYRGQAQSAVLKNARYVSIELQLTMTGEFEEAGAHGTLKGTGTGKGVLLFDAQNGQEIGAYLEIKLDQEIEGQEIEGKEWGQPFKIKQEMMVEMAVQRL